ncbi:MAG: GlxA family transcriptional regulator, partial [Pseudomonadota bacterium]
NGRRVGVLPLRGFAMMSFAALTEPMRAANLLAGKTLYQMTCLSVDGGPVQSSGAGWVQADAAISPDQKLDDLFLIAGGDPARFEDRDLMHWLSRQSRQGTMIGGVSGGPVVLAQAGLMTGRRMTVHWEYAAALAEISPHLAIERSLYVIDRDRVTCAGGTAPLDLMHTLIAKHHGASFARRVTDWFMHTDIRPSAGPQRSGMVERVGTSVPAIIDAIAAMEAHVSDPLTLEDLAARASLSKRQLNRLFRERMQQSVMTYYRSLRLEKARGLLRSSPLRLTEIALATGFANSSHFSRSYAAHFGEPPSAYR